MTRSFQSVGNAAGEVGPALEKKGADPVLREVLAWSAIALTDRVFAALDRAKAHRLMDAMDERGRADIGWRRG